MRAKVTNMKTIHTHKHTHTHTQTHTHTPTHTHTHTHTQTHNKTHTHRHTHTHNHTNTHTHTDTHTHTHMHTLNMSMIYVEMKGKSILVDIRPDCHPHLQYGINMNKYERSYFIRNGN